jgi:hypothetical protein
MPARTRLSLPPYSTHALTLAWALALVAPGCAVPDEAPEVARERAALRAAEDGGGGPLARVAFPPPRSATSETTIRVRGTARAGAGIVSIAANGVAAQTSDGFATWTVEVPLALGYNDIEVVATTAKNGKAMKVADLSVGRDLDLRWPQGLAVDAEGDRVLVTDLTARALYAVDLETGAGRLISSAQRGAGPALMAPRSVAIDASRNRALITDHSHRGVVAVDLDTGDRTLLTGTGAGTGPVFVLPYRIAVDAEADRAYVTDPAQDAVFTVELGSGARALLSGRSAGAGPVMGEPVGVAVDAPAQRLLVTDSTVRAILAVDLATGNRTIVSNSSYCPHCMTSFSDIVLDRANDRALILRSLSDYLVLSMDLDTGAMDSAAQANVGKGPFFRNVQAVALDEARGRLLLASPELRALMALHPPPAGRDLTHSVSVHLTRLAVGGGPRPVNASDGMAWNPRKSLMFELAQRALLMIDAVTGDRRVVAELSPQIHFAVGLERDGDDRVIIGERGGECEVIYSYDLSTGLGTAIGGGESPGPCIEEMADLVSDPARNRLLVLTEDEGLYAIDRATGARTPISGEDLGSGPELAESIMLALDPARDRVLVSDEEYSGLLSVDLTTGDRELIFDDVVVPPPPGDDESSGDDPEPYHMGLFALDTARDEVVAVDRVAGMVFALELATGDYRLISGSYKGRGPRLQYARDVFLDPERDLIMIHDLQLGALVAVDRVTGDRVVAAR